MANEAKKSSLPKEDIAEIVQKLQEEPQVQSNLRPRRAAAVNAAALRKQMIEDNAL